VSFVQDYYLLVKAFHIIAVIAWMAGLLYLPRLYVYHAGVPAQSDMARMFVVMERRLLKFIMNPAMIVTFILGGIMMQGVSFHQGWLHAKLGLVVAMAGFHGALAVWRQDFAAGQNKRSARFYRIANEIPTILMIGIVVLVVLKPF
jgi:protoporphyrinogen IX oxidase